MLATAPAAGAAPERGDPAGSTGKAWAAAPATCAPTSCTYTRTGQSLFQVPAGVSLLQVDVVGAGGNGSGQAVEVKGSLVLPAHATSLEVVVGGKNTLGGTSSELLTSTASTPEVLVAARGTPLGKSRGRQQPGTHSGHLVATPQPASTVVPRDGTVAGAKGRARVVISWRSPWLPATVTSSQLPTLRLARPAMFVVRVSSPVAPRLTERGVLPIGLDFFDQGNGTATIEGIPVVGGVYPLDVTVTAGGAPPVTKHLVLTVSGDPPSEQAGGLAKG